MGAFENSPEALALKEILREFFLGILENIGGSFRGFFEWISLVHLRMPPMLKLFGNGYANTLILAILIGYVIVINIKTYRLFKHDKRYAEDEEERIPEFRLLMNMWLGGAIGGVCAMYKFRHKTQKKKFTMTGKTLVFVQLLLLSFVLGFLGFWTFI